METLQGSHENLNFHFFRQGKRKEFAKKYFKNAVIVQSVFKPQFFWFFLVFFAHVFFLWFFFFFFVVFFGQMCFF